MLDKSGRRFYSIICAIVCSLVFFVYICGLAGPPTTIAEPNLSRYAILNTTINATNAEIKHAYHQKALEYHPDKWQRFDAAKRAEAERRYAEITNSYAFLISDERCDYDRRVMNATLRHYVHCLERMARLRRVEFEFEQGAEKKREDVTKFDSREQPGDQLAHCPSELVVFKSASELLKELLDRAIELTYHITKLAMVVLLALIVKGVTG
ncbi:hypothetical protein GGR58DRAFT_525745 [Xylaria digitata]|nr:hypothetical protein GGR58DRAFT_525745 [Xylaria digitata]